MTIKTEERQELLRVIDTLPDDSIPVVLDFAKGYCPCIPNAETREAIAELRAGMGETVTMEELKAMLDEIE